MKITGTENREGLCFTCPRCDHALFYEGQNTAGLRGICPCCDAHFLMPEYEAPPPPVGPDVDAMCPHCTGQVRIGGRQAGQVIRCHLCNRDFLAPRPIDAAARSRWQKQIAYLAEHPGELNRLDGDVRIVRTYLGAGPPANWIRFSASSLPKPSLGEAVRQYKHRSDPKCFLKLHVVATDMELREEGWFQLGWEQYKFSVHVYIRDSSIKKGPGSGWFLRGFPRPFLNELLSMQEEVIHYIDASK